MRSLSNNNQDGQITPRKIDNKFVSKRASESKNEDIEHIMHEKSDIGSTDDTKQLLIPQTADNLTKKKRCQQFS